MGYYRSWWIKLKKGHTLRITTKSHEGEMYAPKRVYPDRADPASLETMENELFEIARSGARRLLQEALEAEIEAHVTAHSGLFDEGGPQSRGSQWLCPRTINSDWSRFT